MNKSEQNPWQVQTENCVFSKCHLTDKLTILFYFTWPTKGPDGHQVSWPLVSRCVHGRNLVGYAGDVSRHFFTLGFAFGQVSKIKVMFVTFCVKNFSF